MLVFEMYITFIIIGCAMCFVLALLLYLRHKRNSSSDYQITKIVQPYLREELRNFIIPDGIGGLLEIEHLILMKEGFLLIETYPISGNLFGAENMEQWTQVLDGRSFKFNNPLQRIHNSQQALKVLAPKVSVFCRVIFSADSHFPKGKPDEVSTLSSLAQDMNDIMVTSSKNYNDIPQEAWKLVSNVVAQVSRALDE